MAKPEAEVTELIRVRLDADQDVFVLRRLGRAAAELAGLEPQDQVRVATALSEAGRELFGTGSIAVLALGDRHLFITLEHERHSDLSGLEGLKLAGRLVDEIMVNEGSVTLAKRLLARRPPVPVAEIRARLTALSPVSAMDELREQNRELAETLEDLLRLNAELEETNSGVMAMYNQLSAELEETNRGVVALYAELDEKSSQLREANEARNRFWATVSHELRTPLNSVIGLVRLLIGPGGDPMTEEQAHQVRLIGSSTETLLELVSELLDMAKAESGRLDPQPSAVELTRMAEQLHVMLRPNASNGVELRHEVAAEVAELYVDEVMLLRILRNLLSNAVKFTVRGEVRLEAHLDQAKGEAVIVVADTGIGIAPEHLTRVFEDFYQVPGSLQVRSRGTGLGLPYARRLAEALGGTLELASTAGEGTAVTLRLPHYSGPPELERVLIADDDEVFRAAARRMLHGFAANVDEAADGAAALDLMAVSPPDVILVDLLMPRVDGHVLLQRMAEDERLAGIPVVVVTIAPQRASGGVVVLDKHGLRREDLLQAIRSAMGGQA
ncbi:signal transduction histidine kinase [Nonomuraea thailandensis]|uniref:histidine kinase n=1 Tax=Nonomuraea thailandensis TaxID=1188745 RepID=A0A9X2K3L3_9ACTN|nr:ATP-binding protein [Nonomuraea thailandensis]MCP2359153.1 signal transduction histidine kinase [Nonomuraea thailandensis]